MGRFYAHVFDFQDAGLLIAESPASALPLKDRYIIPDILDQRTIRMHTTDKAASPLPNPNGQSGDAAQLGGEHSLQAGRPDFSAVVEGRRPLDDWLATNDQMVILGGPGSGKSTLLRFLAIDLLSTEPKLAAVAERWGRHLPVWVPFPRWTKMIAEKGGSLSITTMIREWLTGWAEDRLLPLVEKALNDDRLLLLVDGLDEWTNEEAASIALERLRVFVDLRKSPAVLASRPHGFQRLGMKHIGWDIGELAPFTTEQQRRLARVWFTFRHASLQDGTPAEEIDRRATNGSDEFLTELSRSPDFSDLARVPLLLCLLIARRMGFR
jgi:hypothetical protein